MYYQQLLTGEMCCYDLEGAKLWSEGKMRFVLCFLTHLLLSHNIFILRFDKKCCNNPSGHPVLRPTRHLNRQQMNKVTNLLPGPKACVSALKHVITVIGNIGNIL